MVTAYVKRTFVETMFENAKLVTDERKKFRKIGKSFASYLAEFDFRYNNRIKLGVNDYERDEKILTGVTGKRLTYERTTA